MINIYTLTTIRTDMEETCDHNTTIYTDEKKAKLIFEVQIDSWLDDIQELIEDRGDEFDKDQWVTENLQCDLNTDTYKYKHFVYDDGSEKIFELKAHEVE